MSSYLTRYHRYRLDAQEMALDTLALKVEAMLDDNSDVDRAKFEAYDDVLNERWPLESSDDSALSDYYPDVTADYA